MNQISVAEIRRNVLFSDLSADEVTIMTGMLERVEYPRDTELFSEGAAGNEMFLIQKGRIAVSVGKTGNTEFRLTDLGPGSFFGEMSMIEERPRSANCRTLEKTVLLGLTHERLEELRKERPEIAAKILYRMLVTTTSRLNDTNALLHDMIQWNEKARLRVLNDGPTGLFNRHFLDEALDSEFRKSLGSRTPLSVAMVDVDRFRELNQHYGEDFANIALIRAADVFKQSFRKGDILARYGDDEFTFLFPGTTGPEALRLCSEACAAVAALDFNEHPDFRITVSIGIATVPDHGQTIPILLDKADKALYAAKEGGRNQAVLAHKDVRPKHSFQTIAERNRTLTRFLEVMRKRKSFLLLGHDLPDEDCIAALVSMALLIQKFDKDVTLYVRDQIPDQLSYLTSICAYNRIQILQGPAYSRQKPDVICILDTPKPDMVALNLDIAQFLTDPGILVLEIDHHLSADAALSGRDGYCFVNRASSTCELIGFICYKLENRKDILDEFQITDLFSRNLVLAMLTGMIGDSKFGLMLKNHRDAFFYALFTNRFSKLLRSSLYKNSKNYSSMTDIFKTIQSLSVEEKELYQKLLELARYSGRTGLVVLDEEESRNYLGRCEYSLFVKVIKSVTDFLSESSGTAGLTVYYDMPEISDLVQFRVRTSRNIHDIDLRLILLDFGITDGGGHPGAIGFRIPKKSVPDLPAFISRILEKIEAL